jgi:hypothetical protein
LNESQNSQSLFDMLPKSSMKRSSSFQKLTDSLLLNGSKVIDKLSKYSNLSGNDSYEVKYHNPGGKDEPSDDSIQINKTRNLYQLDQSSINDAQIKSKLKSSNNQAFYTSELNFDEQIDHRSDSGFGFGR